MPMIPPDWLQGAFTPLVTPFREGRIDFAAYEAAIDRQAVAGSAGVVVTGTTGEPTSLTDDERADLVACAVGAAQGRIRVIAATGTFRQDDTIALSRRAVAAGADAVMIVAPGFVKPTPDGLASYFEAVLARIDRPTLLYNIPGRAGVEIGPAVVRRVADRCDNLIGIKSASADLDYITELLLAHGADFRIFCGLESYAWPMMAIGAAGTMSAVGNVMPQAVAELCAAALAMDAVLARQLHDHLFALNRAVFFETNPGPIKYVLALLGLDSGELRPPLARPSSNTEKRLNDLVTTYGLSIAEEAA